MRVDDREYENIDLHPDRWEKVEGQLFDSDYELDQFDDLVKCYCTVNRVADRGEGNSLTGIGHEVLSDLRKGILQIWLDCLVEAGYDIVWNPDGRKAVEQ